MSSEKGPKHIYAQENELYDYYYHFGEHWEKELKNNSDSDLATVFLQLEAVKKTEANTVMDSRFWLAVYNVL